MSRKSYSPDMPPREAPRKDVPGWPSDLRSALRAAEPLSFDETVIHGCVRRDGLTSLERGQRVGVLTRVIGEVAESVAQVVLVTWGYRLLGQISSPAARGVDLLIVAPDDAILALNVVGTLREVLPNRLPDRDPDTVRTFLNGPANATMADWGLRADDVFLGVAIVHLAQSSIRVALSADLDRFTPIAATSQLKSIYGFRPAQTSR